MKKTFLFIILAAISTPASAAEKKFQFMAGAAKAVMTPDVEPWTDSNKNGRWDEGESFQDKNGNGKWDPVWIAGYQGGRAATGVHDNLWITSLAMSDGKDPLIFITVDLIGYMFDEISEVKAQIKKELDVPPSRVFIFSTHDHSGPDAIGLWGVDGKTGKDQNYLDTLRSRIVLCAKQALSELKPAKARFGKIHYGDPIEDSRPPKVINDMLLTMQVTAADGGKTIATFVNYAMHAEVLDGGNSEITSDYPGVLRENLEKKFGGVAMFAAADIGGMQSPFVLFHTFWSRERVGKSLAEKVIESLDKQRPREIKSLAVHNEEILFPIENKRYLEGMESGRFGRTSEFIKKDSSSVFLPADLNLIEIGPAQFLTLPGEAFPELGNLLRAKMGQDFPFVLGLCDNEIGYIVPNDEWHDDGYEENMSLGRRTTDTLFKAVSDLFSKL